MFSRQAGAGCPWARMLLAEQGYHVPQIAAIPDCREDVVRHQLHRYKMNDAVAANRLAGSMEDLVRAATRFFTEMTTEQPVFLPIAA